MIAWLSAFVWTFALEYPVYAAGLGRSARRWWEPLAWTLGVNVATHPLFSWWALTTVPGPGALLGAEAAIAVAEGLLLACALRHRAPPWHAFVTALVANAGSFLVGGWIVRVLG